MATQVVGHKLKHETLTLDFDVLSRLRVGESATTAICTVTVHSGVDPAPEDMLVGVASMSNNIASQQITGGVAGVIYKVTCAVRTSANNVVIQEAMLAVLNSSANLPA